MIFPVRRNLVSLHRTGGVRASRWIRHIHRENFRRAPTDQRCKSCDPYDEGLGGGSVEPFGHGPGPTQAACRRPNAHTHGGKANLPSRVWSPFRTGGRFPTGRPATGGQVPPTPSGTPPAYVDIMIRSARRAAMTVSLAALLAAGSVGCTGPGEVRFDRDGCSIDGRAADLPRVEEREALVHTGSPGGNLG